MAKLDHLPAVGDGGALDAVGVGALQAAVVGDARAVEVLAVVVDDPGDIPQLALGTPASGSLNDKQKKYYRVDVSAGLDLRLRLTSDLSSAANEVYVAFNRTPTTSDFDFNASESFKSNRELMIPSTQNGSYYVLIFVRNMVGPTSQNFTIAADALPFSLTV